MEGGLYDRKGQVASPGSVLSPPFTPTAKKVNQSNTEFLVQLKRLEPPPRLENWKCDDSNHMPLYNLPVWPVGKAI